MPKDPPQKTGGPRQRPVSCKFCRTRKLRCSRESPCSNCLSRKLTCELEQPADNGSIIDGADKAELLERIRKLEEIVEQSARPTTIPNRTISPGVSLEAPAINSHALDGFGDSANHTKRDFIPSANEQLDRDFAWLESIYDGTDSAVSTTPLRSKSGYLV